jgi:hypothetical protein
LFDLSKTDLNGKIFTFRKLDHLKKDKIKKLLGKK